MTRSCFRQLPFMGVIRVNDLAMREFGYTMGDPSWTNLGQGQPEVGTIDGAPPRCERISIAPADHAYGPVEGIDELREAVAAHYNRLYRQGKASQYTAENVAIASGGRLALTRCGATLDLVRLGYFTPDYTAYEDLLSAFPNMDPVLIALEPDQGFAIAPDELEARIVRDKLDAILISNPCNPTGVAARGDDLAAWLDIARRRGTTMLLDEFYSHFVYEHGGEVSATPGNAPISSAAYVDDVNEDPVVIADGLTKCFRYPGWRIGWVVAPKSVIRTMTAAGSFLDGGASRPVQRAAIDVLEPARADQETTALRNVFCAKRNKLVEHLEGLGVTFPARPTTTFYAFGSVAGLPAPLNTGEGFMRAALSHRVLSVPGAYFDVDPGRTREGASRLDQFVRFSFGPPMDNMREGLDRLSGMMSNIADGVSVG